MAPLKHRALAVSQLPFHHSFWSRSIWSPIFASRAFQRTPTRITPCGKLVYFDELNLVYNRVQKNANTTTTAFFCELNGQNFGSHIEAISMARRLPWRSFRELPNFHTLVVIRNPYSRLLSAFLQKFGHRRADYASRYGDFDVSPVGFRSFVEYLLEHGIGDDSHWDLQMKQIPFPLSAYDSVIRFERYSIEISEMLRIRGIEFESTKLEMLYPSDTGKRTDADLQIQNFYDEKSVLAVRTLYSSDFAFLGYSTKFE